MGGMNDDADKDEHTEEDAPKKRRVWPWALLALAAAVVGLLAALPTVLMHVDLPAATFDLEPLMTPEAKALFTNHTVKVHVDLGRSDSWDLIVRGEGTLLDWPFTLKAKANYSIWKRSAKGMASISLDGTGWTADAKFSGSVRDGWNVELGVPETKFDENDPVVGAIVSRLPAPAITGLVYSGSLRVDARASTTNSATPATWTANASVSDLDASLSADGTPVEVSRLRIRAGASGLGDHVDFAPMFPRAESVVASGVALSNVFASVRATETAWLVTEAGADVCGGKAKLYALFLDPAKLNAGFTLFLDDIDTGRVLNSISGLHGEATGRLHGKIPLRVTDGSKLSIGDSYLYSTPGQPGTLKLTSAAPILEGLAAAGVPEADRSNLSKALANLTYTALALNLRRDQEGEHALEMKLEGSATSGKTTVPVSFGVTFHGDIEHLINTGIRASGKGKSR